MTSLNTVFRNRIFRAAALSAATTLFAAAPALATTATLPSSHLQLKTTNAKLNHALDSSHVKLGQRVTARTTMALHTPNGVTLPRRTRLIGKVTGIQKGQGKPTTMSLVFTQARLRNGHTIPIKATLLGVKPPYFGADAAYQAGRHFPDSSRRVAYDAQVTQEPGAIRHVTMHSSALSHNSATFQRKHGNIDLRRGTQFRIAIAPLHQSTTKAG